MPDNELRTDPATLRLHLGELTADEVRIAQAAIRYALSHNTDRLRDASTLDVADKGYQVGDFDPQVVASLTAQAPASFAERFDGCQVGVTSAPEVVLEGLLANLVHNAGDVEDECPSIDEDEDAYWAWQQYHAIHTLADRVRELEASSADNMTLAQHYEESCHIIRARVQELEEENAALRENAARAAPQAQAPDVGRAEREDD